MSDVTPEQAANTIRDGWRDLRAALIAVNGHLNQPYPDDPRWTPWTRFVEPALGRMDADLAALKVLENAANRAEAQKTLLIEEGNVFLRNLRAAQETATDLAQRCTNLHIELEQAEARADGWLTSFYGSGIEWHESLPNPYTYKASDFSALVAAVHEYEARLMATEARAEQAEQDRAAMESSMRAYSDLWRKEKARAETLTQALRGLLNEAVKHRSDVWCGDYENAIEAARAALAADTTNTEKDGSE